MARHYKKTTTSTRGQRTTLEQYEKLVAAYNEELGAHTRAAKAAGVSVNTARRAYTTGLGKDMPAIQTIIQRSMVEARAKLARYESTAAEEQEVAAQAAKALADSRAMQARSLRLSRNNSIASMGMGSNLLRAGIHLSSRVETLMSDSNWMPSPSTAVSLLRGITDINRQAIEMAKMSEEMEARILGQPDLVMAHVSMTPDQAVLVMQETERTMNRLRRRAARGDLPEGINPAIIDTGPVTYKDAASTSPEESPTGSGDKHADLREEKE